LYPAEAFARIVSLTVYNQDLGYVRDRRERSIKEGESEVTFPGVPSRIDPTSVRVLFPGGDRARVLSQGYRYDTAETGRFLELALGKEIAVGVRRGDMFRGVLIGFDADALFIREGTSMVREKDEAVVSVRREHITDVHFPDIGGDLVMRPTLTWKIHSPRGTTMEIEASYLVSGMSWHVEYAATAGGEGEPLTLSAWASVDNRCGGAFEDASLTLVAGVVSRAPAAAPKRREMMAVADAGAAFAEQELFEYHAYSLDEKLTIRNNETVQLPLFEPGEVAYERVYIYDPTRFSSGVKVTAKTENTEAMGLGRPLPRGVIRVYAAGESGESFLIGEDSLNETPVGAEIDLFLGVAFDIKGERKRTDYARHARNDYEESFEIKLKNSKSVPVEIRVVEHPHGDWSITAASHEFEEKDSNTVQWVVSVPANGETTVSYTVRYRS
jgi:hypothetical protein